MTANKMPVLPEMPEAAGWKEGGSYTTAQMRDYGRACYLAGLEAAKACVPANWCDPLLTGDKAVIGKPPYGCPDIEAILGEILTNLTALEQEAKK